MSKKKLEISLNEIDIETNTKKTIKELLQNVITKANSQLGSAEQTIVKIPDTIISINAQRKQSKAPTLEECLQPTGLDRSIKIYISEEKKGNIKKSHINDIIKTCIDTNVLNLNAEFQKNLVDKVIENRNLANMRNREYSSTLLIKEGSTDNIDIENWSSGIIRLVKELLDRVDMDKSTYKLLDREQRRILLDMLKSLKEKIENVIKMLE